MSLSRIQKGTMAACAAGGLIGIVASMIPDAAINGELTWSWIVAASIVYALGMALPAVWSPRRGWLVSLLWMSAGLLPFLLCVEEVCNRYLLDRPVKWFSELALPLAGLWLAVVWVIVLFGWLTRRFWFTIALACLLAGVGSFITNMLTQNRSFGQMLSSPDAVINAGAALTLAFVCFAVGLCRRPSGKP